MPAIGRLLRVPSLPSHPTSCSAVPAFVAKGEESFPMREEGRRKGLDNVGPPEKPGLLAP
jgi:hypothetical protein